MIEKNDIDRCAPERLAELMDAGMGDRENWSPDEYATLLRHELSVPVSFDLGGLGGRVGGGLRAICDTEGLMLKSLGDLFSHPSPPLELLKLTKDYAKACRHDRHGPIPEEIAVVLYFVSVCAALVKCHKRITGLDDRSLRQGIEQVLQLPWLDASLHDLLQRVLAQLDTKEPGL